MEINLLFVKVKLILERKQCLLSCILDWCGLRCLNRWFEYWAKGYTYRYCNAGLILLYISSTNGWHRGRSTTLRNQQRENFVINDPFYLLIGIGTNQNGWDNKHPSRLYFGYPDNHRRSLKWIIPENGALGTKKIVGVTFSIYI